MNHLIPGKNSTLGLLTLFITAASFLFITACSSPDPGKEQKLLIEQGDQLFEKGRYQDAIRTWKSSGQKRKIPPMVLVKMARANEMLGYLPEAFRLFDRALKEDPDLLEARIKRAELAIYFRDWAIADKDIQVLLKSLPQSHEPYRLKGDLAAARGDFKGAEGAYRHALALVDGPASSDLLNRLKLRIAFCALAQDRESEALALLEKLKEEQGLAPALLKEMGDFYRLLSRNSEAERFFKEAISSMPQNMAWRADLALLYLESKELLKAQETIEQLLSLDPKNRYAKKILLATILKQHDYGRFQEIYDSLGPEEKSDIEIELLAAQKNIYTGEFLSAASFLQAVIEKEPDLALAHYLMGVAYLAAGHDNLGKNSLIKSLTLNRYFSQADLALADFYLKSSKTDIAHEYARRVAEREPLNYRAWQIEALTFMEEQRPKKALEALRRVELLNPGAETNALLLARMAAMDGKKSQALAMYSQCLKENSGLKLDILKEYLDLLGQEEKDALAAKIEALEHEHPDNPWLLILTADYWIRIGRPDQARKNLEAVIEMAPSIRAPYMMLAGLYRPSSKKREEILKELIKRFPNYIAGYQQLANFYLNSGNIDMARTLLEQAHSIAPNDPLLNSNLAWIYGQEDDSLDEAMPLAMKAYELSPDNPAIQDTMAWIYYRKGLIKRAQWLLEELIRKRPNDPLILYHLALTQLDSPQTRDTGIINLKRAAKLACDPKLASEIDHVLAKALSSSRKSSEGLSPHP
jgi:tetratricopeptide (TPR) repeat protein